MHSPSQKSRASWKGNLVTVVCSTLLGVIAIEGLSRVLEEKQKPAALEELNLRPWPYMMMVGPHFRDPTWWNTETDTNVSSRMAFNNLGFTNERDFSFPPDRNYLDTFGKKSGEKLIVITGGSAAHGVGATSNETTAAGQLEKLLNERQTRYRYRVLNLANAGWVAYQQFIGLALFGLPLDPDWAITMDGHNDATVTCAHGSGAGNPIEWPKLLYLLGGGKELTRPSPVMQWLLANSAAARIVTGLPPEGRNSTHEQLKVDDSDGDKRFNIKMRDVTFKSLDRQIVFYLQAEKSVKDIFPHANVLFSTQPLLHRNPVSRWYRKAFNPASDERETTNARKHLEADLDAYMTNNAEGQCGQLGTLHPLAYFIARSALGLERQIGRWATAAPNRALLYANVETLFPERYHERFPFFIDNVHMSDMGQKRVAELYAGLILQTDLGVPFTLAALSSAVKNEAEGAGKLFGSFLPRPKLKGRPLPGHYTAQGSSVSSIEADLLRIEEKDGLSLHGVQWNNFPVSDGKINLTIDAWFNGDIDSIRLAISDSSGNGGWAKYDLAVPKVTDSQGTSGAFIERLPNGWRRLSIMMRPQSQTASLLLELASPEGDLAGAYLGEQRALIVSVPASLPK
jgi:hypothetical protein